MNYFLADLVCPNFGFVGVVHLMLQNGHDGLFDFVIYEIFPIVKDCLIGLGHCDHFYFEFF